MKEFTNEKLNITIVQKGILSEEEICSVDLDLVEIFCQRENTTMKVEKAPLLKYEGWFDCTLSVKEQSKNEENKEDVEKPQLFCEMMLTWE